MPVNKNEQSEVGDMTPNLRGYSHSSSADKSEQGLGMLNLTKGTWNKAENLKYYLYVYHHKKQIEDVGVRRSLQHFKGMSYFIKTRSPTQCRTRHNKELQKYGNVTSSLQTYCQKVLNFDQIYHQVKEQLDIQSDHHFFSSYSSPPQCIANNSQDNIFQKLKVKKKYGRETVQFVDNIEEEMSYGKKKGRKKGKFKRWQDGKHRKDDKGQENNEVGVENGRDKRQISVNTQPINIEYQLNYLHSSIDDQIIKKTNTQWVQCLELYNQWRRRLQNLMVDTQQQ